MTTSIEIIVHTDDTGSFAEELRRINALPDGVEKWTFLAAIHAFEAQRLQERIGWWRGYNRRYPARKK